MLDRVIAEDLLKKAEYESINNDNGVSYETSIILQEAISRGGGHFLDYLNMQGDKLLFNAKRFKRHFIDGKFKPNATNPYFKSDAKLFEDHSGNCKKFFEQYDGVISQTNDCQSKINNDESISCQLDESNPTLKSNIECNNQVKKLIFFNNIYDGDVLAWCSNKEYIVTFENDELFYVTSENSSDGYSVEKKSEGSLFEIII